MRDPYRSPDNVSNLHTVVVYHVRQVICRMTIRFQQNWIIIDSINQIQFAVVGLVLSRFAINQVIEHGISFDLQTDYVCLALGGSVL
jgi:hypothetical protein